MLPRVSGLRNRLLRVRALGWAPNLERREDVIKYDELRPELMAKSMMRDRRKLYQGSFRDPAE